MLQEVYEIDSNGFIIDNYVGEFNEGALVTDFGDKVMVLERLPQPLLFYKPSWDGAKWVEGETAEEKAERESAQALESLKPSPEELADAELEIKVITMLTEMGVIQ